MPDIKLREWARDCENLRNALSKLESQVARDPENFPESYHKILVSAWPSIRRLEQAGESLIRQCAEIAQREYGCANITACGERIADAILSYYRIEEAKP